MDNKLEKIVQALQSDFDATFEEFRNEAHVFVRPDQIVDVITSLRDVHEFELLSAMTAVDYWPQALSPLGEEPRFHVIYQLTSIAKNLSIQIRVPVAATNPVVPTVSGVFASANWREREIPRRILMPADWEGHPLRKDYPLGYEEPQFTFNFEEINLRKPYAKE